MRSVFTALVALTTLALSSGQNAPAPRRIAITPAGVLPGQPQLFIAAADGTDEHLLLQATGIDYNPAWAPDGNSIVFTSERNGSADLFRVNPDGSGLVRLTTETSYDDQAAVSPDGKQLVFVSTRGKGTANLWILDLAAKKAKELTSGPGGDFRPSWSPDGKWIAFSSGRGVIPPFSEGRWERQQIADIYVLHPDGSGLKKLTTGGNFCGSPKWTSDNQRIIAYCMTAQQTMETRLTPPPAGSRTRLVGIDIATATSTEVSAGAGMKISPSPLAGNDIGYVRKDGPDPGIDYVSGRRGPRGPVRTASWSPDGKRVVYWKLGPPTFPAKTFSRNPNYELSFNLALPALSPSGKQVLVMTHPIFGIPVVSKFDINPALAVLAVTSTETTGPYEVLYQDKTRNLLPGGWSPAGDKIIFSVGMFPAFFDGFNSSF